MDDNEGLSSPPISHAMGFPLQSPLFVSNCFKRRLGYKAPRAPPLAIPPCVRGCAGAAAIDHRRTDGQAGTKARKEVLITAAQ